MSCLRRRQLLALGLSGRHFARPLRLSRGGRHERQGGGEQERRERHAASAAHEIAK
jgi:hypothetical protein